MSEAAEFVLNKVVADFLKAGIEAGSLTGVPTDLTVRQGRDVDERQRPCVVVDSEPGDPLHPKLFARDLTVEILTQRDDTPGEDVSSWVAEVRTYLAVRVMELCGMLHAEGWVVRTWTSSREVDDEDGERGWREGQEYKVVLMSVQ